MNAMAVYILSTTKSMKNVFNSLLICLYCFDTTFLISHIYLIFDLKYNRTQRTITTILSRFIKLLYSVAFKASIFMTVGMSHERFIAMRHPLVHHALMSSTKSRRLRFMKYFVPIIIVACLLVVPEYMDLELVWELKNLETGQTLQNSR